MEITGRGVSMQSAAEHITAFLLGFFLYTALEIAGRGYTHWTMALTGGIALALLYHMEATLTASRLTKAALGACFVTAMEFAVGVVDNLIMGWAVWDYSEIRTNLLGQICLPFSALWFVLCLLASLLCRGLYRRFHPCASGKAVRHARFIRALSE